MVIKNKFGLTDLSELERIEEKYSKIKAAKLFDEKILDILSVGKFEALSKIHKYIFDEIYHFAGEIRDVNIAKGNFRFAPVMYLKSP